MREYSIERLRLMPLFFSIALGLGAASAGSTASAAPVGVSAQSLPALGPNVTVFDPSMPVSADSGHRRRDLRPAGRRTK